MTVYYQIRYFADGVECLYGTYETRSEAKAEWDELGGAPCYIVEVDKDGNPTYVPKAKPTLTKLESQWLTADERLSVQPQGWHTFEELCEMLGKAMANGWYLNALFIHQELRSRLSEAQFGA